MFRKYVTWILILGIVLPAFMVGGLVSAQGREISEKRESPEAVALEADLQRKEEELDRVTGRLEKVGVELEESQVRVDQARAHQKELGRRAREMDEALEAQKEAAALSRSRLEHQIQVAYKGEALAGILLLVESLFGGNDARDSAPANLQATRLLAESRKSIQHYKDTKQNLRSTLQQLEQSKAEYRSFGEQSQTLVDELKGRESELRASVEDLGLRGERVEERLAQLEAKEEAGLLDRPPATSMEREDRRRARNDGDLEKEEAMEREEEVEREEARERELEIAREDIVTRPVEPIPYEEYVRLYRESAGRYGFAGDWHVLAAVGKIESNHGENMGPSSAGAMGPMQFLPSTWSSYGVDGNGDGVANIMDPEDAIPGAAAYLKAGGAPDDWYAALFTYNRAGWYVEEVLAIAESYRRIHGDDTVGPYLEPAPARPATTSPSIEPPLRQDNVLDGVEESTEEPTPEIPPPPEGAPRSTDDGLHEQDETPIEPNPPAAGEETTAVQYQY